MAVSSRHRLNAAVPTGQPLNPAVPTRCRLPRSRWLPRYRAVLVVIDSLAAAIASVLAYTSRFGFDASDGHAAFYLVLSALLPVAWIAVLAGNRAYDAGVLGAGADEFRRIGRSFVLLTATFAFVSYAIKADLARGFVLVVLPATLVLDVLARFVTRGYLHRVRRRGSALSRVLVVGSPDHAVDLIKATRRDVHGGLAVVAACLSGGRHDDIESMRELSELGVPVLGELDDVVDVVARLDAEAVAVTGSAELGPAKLRWISWQLEGTGVDLIVSPGLLEVAGTRLHVRPLLSNLPLLQVEAPRFTGFHRMLKSGFDRGVAGLALTALSPIFVMIAVLVRSTSHGPAFFRQTRVGRDGRKFVMLKFRSMYVGDGLTVLGRERERVRSALAFTAGLCLAACFAMSVGTVLLFHLADLPVALLYAAMIVLWLLEETGRRVLMSRLEFWRLVGNDAAYVVVTVGSLSVALLAGWPASLGLVLGCMAIGALAAIVLARAQLPRAEYERLRPRSTGVRAVGRFGLWRSLQAALRQLQQLLPQLLVKIVDGSGAVGSLNYGRLVVAPVQSALGAAAALLLATTAADAHSRTGSGRLHQRISLVLVALTAASGAIAAVFSYQLGRLLTKHPVPHLLVLGWAAYLVAWAASLPFTAQLTVRQLTRPVFMARLVETVVGVTLISAALIGGASSEVLPWLLAAPAGINVWYVRHLAIRGRRLRRHGTRPLGWTALNDSERRQHPDESGRTSHCGAE